MSELVVQLDDDRSRAIDEARRWESDAERELGMSYRELHEVKQRMREAEEKVHEKLELAEHATQQRMMVMATICNMLDLPAGEWTYDPERRSMVRKESHGDQT